MGVSLCKTASHSFANMPLSRAVVFFTAVDLYLQSLTKLINLVLYIAKRFSTTVKTSNKNATSLLHFSKAQDISGYYLLCLPISS